jgi:hypothetical protein
LVEVFERTARRSGEPSRTCEASGPPRLARPTLTWQDAIRCLELDDAARRSVQHRRVSTLEYPEATEEVGFKGTMTLVGCGLLLTSVLVLVLSRLFPSRVWWVIVPVFLLFLGLQLLRWLIPSTRDARGPSSRQDSF